MTAARQGRERGSARTAALGLLLAAALAGLSGCGASAIRADRVQAAVGRTFTNLYIYQQGLLDHPGLTVQWVAGQAGCLRRGASPPDRGAGDDWQCQLSWHAFDGSAQQALYDVQVRTNGCFTATGPPAVVGRQTLYTSGGRARVNPLYQFDGCFDPS